MNVTFLHRIERPMIQTGGFLSGKCFVQGSASIELGPAALNKIFGQTVDSS